MTRDHTKLRPYDLATAKVGDKVLTSCPSEHATVVAVSGKYVAFLWENEIINTLRREEDDHDLHIAPLAWHQDGTPIYEGDSLWIVDETNSIFGKEFTVLRRNKGARYLTLSDNDSASLIDDTIECAVWGHTKPVRTIRIGEFDVPEPVWEPLEDGQRYWAVDFDGEATVYNYHWQESRLDYLWLKRGLIHLTQEAAELHAKALLSFTQTD